jgi:hypothetical protein
VDNKGIRVHIADRVLVVHFLARAKELIAAGRLRIRDRAKNLATLTQLGLLVEHQVEILQALTPHDYYHNLDPEQGMVAGAWVFGVIERGEELYIKLVIIEDTEQGDYLICVSFHVAERRLEYPYQETK